MVFSTNAESRWDVKYSFRVVDEENNVVSNANVSVAFTAMKDESDPWKGEKEFITEGATDVNGCWKIEGRTLNYSTVSVRKQGYYPSGVKLKNYRLNNEAKQDKTNQEETIIIRKIKNPIPMYQWGIQRMEYPVKTNEWVGYDMLQAEWMPPYGKGLKEDLQICVAQNRGKRNIEKTALSVVSVRFVGKYNGVEGISERSVSSQSRLRLPYFAPRDGYTMQELVVSLFVTIEGTPVYVGSTGTTNCFFRIRSQVDTDGNFLDGLHGKIMGPVSSGGGKNIKLEMNYYVNPTPNDLNMEFDTKHNLVPKKESKVGVYYP
jgi:hypothetical protein